VQLRLASHDAVDRQAFRVGYSPDPWAWTPWEYATGGRFGGRFDDPDGLYRTLYAGDSPLTCLLEVLAKFRPDPAVLTDLDAIDSNAQTEDENPTRRPGAIPLSWLANRSVGTASLTGHFADIGDKESIPALRAALARWLVHYGLPDLDGAAIRSTVPRGLTQQLGQLVHAARDETGRLWDGVLFESRHGNDLLLWAIFERGGEARSHTLADTSTIPLVPEDPAFVEAARLHGLHVAG
jgi:hypothetical protein